MQPGILHLIPTPLGAIHPIHCLPQPVIEQIIELRHFAAEQPKTARAFLNQFRLKTRIQEINIQPLPKNATLNELEFLLSPLMAGENMGVLSDAGCPAVADPGAGLVALAHTRGIRVIPYIGPSAVLLSLMASGFNGQRFAFHGYLPITREDRYQAIKTLESDSAKGNETKIFIETPYRNNTLLDDLLATLKPDTRLAVACDLTLPSEWIQSRAVRHWNKIHPDLNRRPSIFLLLATKP